MKAIIEVFLNVNMGRSHDGLGEIAKKNKIDVGSLEPGTYVVFINRAQNRAKIYAHGDVIAYWRAASGQKLNLETIQNIPRAFQGKAISYDDALTKVLTKRLMKITPTALPPILAVRRQTEMHAS